MSKIGKLESVWRYPVKSMRGEEVDEIFVSFAGLMGDRVYAISATSSPKEFPWHTAREYERFVLHQAYFKNRKATLKPDNMQEALDNPAVLNPAYPTKEAFAVNVKTPDGEVYDIESPEFLENISGQSEGQLKLHYTQRSITDCRPVTLFSLQTLEQLKQETKLDIDKLQFRSNFYVDWDNSAGFYEDQLVGKKIHVGDTVELMIIERDPRCKFITINPETAETEPKLLKHVTRKHEGFTGVYAAVLKEGPVNKGDEIVIAE